MLSKLYFKIVNRKFKLEANIPKILRIETTNLCNSKCTFCMHSKMKREKGFMNDELFNKILKESIEYGIDEVHLQNFGEPLMDKTIFNKIKSAKEIGIKKVILFTNGSLLNEESCEKLIKSGLDELFISFEGYSPEEYNKTRIGLDFDTTSNNIKNLYKIRKQQNSLSPKIIINTVYDKTKKKYKNNFYNKWINFCDDIRFQTLHNWCNKKSIEVKNKFCQIPWSYMTILWNGDVVFCCLDYEGENIMGNIKENTIREIWNGVRYKSIRKILLENKLNNISLCARCSLVHQKKWNLDQLK